MVRAIRYSNINVTPAQELSNYYMSVERDAQLEYNASVDRYFEEEEYNAQFGDSSQIGWLVQNKGMSFIDAAVSVAEEEKRWRKETYEWLTNPANYSDVNYSDIYKDYYGFRPRF